MSTAPELRFEVTLGESTRLVRIQRRAGRAAGDAHYRVIMGTGDDERTHEVDVCRPEAGVLSLMLAGRSVEAGLVPIEDGYVVDVRGASAEIMVVDPRKKALRTAQGAGGNCLKSQMPGRIVRLLAAEGDTVQKGQPVIVVEAMKMENELKAPVAGVVQRVHVAVGDVIEARAVLVDFG